MPMRTAPLAFVATIDAQGRPDISPKGDPAGFVKIGATQYSVRLNNAPESIAALNDLPVKVVNGATIYMRDVAYVRDGAGPQQNIVHVEGSRSALLTVLKNGSMLDPAGSYPAKPPLSLNTLNEAEYYYDKGLPILQRYLPFRIASLADRYIILAIPLLVLLFPLFKAIGPIYQWRIRARIYRWYKHLREIDQQLYQGKLPSDLDAEILRLERLEDELARIEVPLSYSSELYQLHMHLRYMIERLNALQQRTTAKQLVG